MNGLNLIEELQCTQLSFVSCINQGDQTVELQSLCLLPLEINNKPFVLFFQTTILPQSKQTLNH